MCVRHFRKCYELVQREKQGQISLYAKNVKNANLPFKHSKNGKVQISVAYPANQPFQH